jgi:hypothetical protein
MEEWKKLCEQAATEQDPAMPMELAGRIVELLDNKHVRLEQHRRKNDDPSPPRPNAGK